METIYKLEPEHITQLHTLYQNESWSKGRTFEETNRCVENSSFCVGVLDKSGKLIAFTRVLTDMVFKALIFDVIVDKKYRGGGLGNALVSAVKTHPNLSHVKHIELYCLPELEAFYQRHGFTTEVNNMRLMRLVRETNQ
jgi:N-acetylglutamate synthase-like GNAT family acetyltransferase